MRGSMPRRAPALLILALATPLVLVADALAQRGRPARPPARPPAVPGPAPGSAPTSRGGRGEFSSGQEKRWESRGGGESPDQGKGSVGVPGTDGPDGFLIRLGDSVKGAIDRTAPIRIRFAAVAGARIRLTLRPATPKSVLSAHLLDPAGEKIEALKPTAAASTTLALGDRTLKDSGVHTVVLAHDAIDPIGFRLESRGVLPAFIDREFRLEAGRPVRIEVGGIEGRMLRQADVQRLGEEPCRLQVTWSEPNGRLVDLEDAIIRASSGRWLTFGDLPMEANGDYLLTVADLGRSAGDGRVRLRFTDRRLPPRVHQLTPAGD